MPPSGGSPCQGVSLPGGLPTGGPPSWGGGASFEGLSLLGEPPSQGVPPSGGCLPAGGPPSWVGLPARGSPCRGPLSKGGGYLGGLPAGGSPCQGGLPARGVSLPGGLPAGGCLLPGGLLCRETPLWTDRHLLKHNLRKLRLRAVKNTTESIRKCENWFFSTNPFFWTISYGYVRPNRPSSEFRAM